MNPILTFPLDVLYVLSLKSVVDQPTSEDSPFADWNENDTTPCRWSDISCMNITGYPDPRVIRIFVSGSIPDQLFNATSLHSLFFYGNNLSGSLPPLICNLPMLKNLDLSNNSLSSSFPKNLKNFKQLQRLILAENKFNSEIHGGIWPKLDNLVQLDCSSNEFNGLIPVQSES
ncbi:hypothetical protein GQ457_03G029860 [Hibiscus cannabinus]